MSIKSKVLAAAATMAMAGGVSAVGLLPADAATEEPTSLGPAYAYGQEYRAPFVLDVLRQGEEAGQPVILFRASSTDPAEDFTIANEGLVSVLATDGLVSSALALNYSTDKAYELEYSPYGVDSGLCVGTGSTAGNGTPVALEACGSSSKTVWVADTADIVASTIGPPASPAYTPLINGSDTNFSHPFVLHYPGDAYPTDLPRPQLNTYNLQKYAGITPTVFNNEEWTGIVLPPV